MCGSAAESDLLVTMMNTQQEQNSGRISGHGDSRRMNFTDTQGSSGDGYNYSYTEL
jgi:hypothetical protein